MDTHRDDREIRSFVSSPETRNLDPGTEAQKPVRHNAGLRRFEMCDAGLTEAFLSYTREGDRVILDHTFVPVELRGRGLAAQLTVAALDEARQQGWKVVPQCSYVARFIERNPRFADLLADRTPP